MPDRDRQFYLDEIRRAWVTGRIDKHTALQRLQEQFGDPTAEAMRFVDEKYNREDDVASAITGTPYLSIKVPMDPYHPVYVPREHTNHGTEQRYRSGCKCKVCRQYAIQKSMRPQTVTYPKGTTVTPLCTVCGRSSCHPGQHGYEMEPPHKTGDALAEMDMADYGKLRSGLIGAGQRVFDAPTGHTPSYECSCKDCLKKLPPFPLEDQVAPLIEASGLSEHEVRVMLWKSWLDLNPELKPKPVEKVSRRQPSFAVTLSYISLVVSFICMFAGIGLASWVLAGVGMGLFVPWYFVALLFKGKPKLWSPKMGWRTWSAYVVASAFLAFAVCTFLFAFAMMFYTALFSPSSWPF